MKKQNPYSLYTWMGLVAVLAGIRYFLAPFDKTLTWDVFGYYLYFPAFFIYQDPLIQNPDWLQAIVDQYHSTGTLYQLVESGTGNQVMRYPMGLAVLNLPFMWVGHLLATPLGYAPDGFSRPYQVAWCTGGLFYASLGLYWLRQILLKFFGDGFSAFLLVLLVLGTNWINLATYAVPLAHIFVFCLVTGIFRLLLDWKEKVNIRSAGWVGFLIGLLAMCRPNELLILLLPLLWWAGKKFPLDRFAYYFDNRKAVLALIGGMFIGGLPQLLYWKYSSGHWLFYSYQDPAVGFDFLNPHTWPFLFSYRKGWWIYTPLMLLLVPGFYFLYRQKRHLFWPLLLFFVANLYLVSSWTCWWYAGGCYSSRSMVGTYALWMIPVGFSLQAWKSWGSWTRYPLYTFVLLICALNLFQFWQFNSGIIDGERMTGAYYWRIFGKTEVAEEDKKWLLPERQADAYEVLPEYALALPLDTLVTAPEKADREAGIYPDSARGVVYVLDSVRQFTPAWEASFKELAPGGEYAWLRISAEIWLPSDFEGPMPLLVAHFQYKDKPYKYVASENQVAQMKRGGWNRIHLDYMTPEVRSRDDRFKTYIWHRGHAGIKVARFRVQRYTPAGR